MDTTGKTGTKLRGGDRVVFNIISDLAHGKNNQKIAEELYLSPGTVRVHIHAILQKLGVKDRKTAAQLYSTHLES